MSFWTSIKNAPAQAEYWMPVFYYVDPATGLYSQSFPDHHLDLHLDLPESWLCPLSAGEGLIVDYRCIIYDSGYNEIAHRDLYNIVVMDDVEFIYNWEGEGISPWAVAVPIGLAVILGVAVVAGRRRR